MAAEKACKTCKYFCVTKEGESHGGCRRYPPMLILPGANREDTLSSSPKFPAVSAELWCGDYEKRPTGKPRVVQSYQG